ncbi:unnamed protein product [Symbiodinium natans]|uniref:Uncharacterized protein n=1 Tax=Symbiodinium natans TaxID=878477 RepID=A0A812I9I2_9DINO|nr:unnamed protein product [Symbiodinium natans]
MIEFSPDVGILQKGHTGHQTMATAQSPSKAGASDGASMQRPILQLGPPEAAWQEALHCAAIITPLQRSSALVAGRVGVYQQALVRKLRSLEAGAGATGKSGYGCDWL